jgi:hypothetical protein
MMFADERTERKKEDIHPREQTDNKDADDED